MLRDGLIIVFDTVSRRLALSLSPPKEKLRIIHVAGFFIPQTFYFNLKIVNIANYDGN